MQIKDSLALVTGASTGIGATIAKQLAAHGARVILVARNQIKLDQIADEIRIQGSEAHVCAVDLGDPATVEKTLVPLFNRIGTPDLIVNSAGAGRWLFTEETTPEELKQMMDAPFFAAFYVTRLCLPAMLKNKRGHIVNINSPVVAFGGWPGAAGYTAARYALMGFTNALRLDLKDTGINVTSIVPGKVKDSEYFMRNVGALARAPKIALTLIREVTTYEVAAATLKAIRLNKREEFIPFILYVFVLINHFAPRLIEWLLWRTGWRHGQGKTEN